MAIDRPHLNQLERLGIAGFDEAGVDPSVLPRLLRSIGLDADAPSHRTPQPPKLEFAGPLQCHVPEWLSRAPAWGITTQLYELRSSRSCGIGDFEDLSALCKIAARAGADCVGITPLHAPFLSDPRRCSPFSPSSRYFLNPLYIALDRVHGYGDVAGVENDAFDLLAEMRLIDYRKVADVKLSVLKRLWRHWLKDPAATKQRASFDRFRAGEGEALRFHALFEALSAEMVAQGYGAGWTSWPLPLHDPRSREVSEISARLADEIAFHEWLQWVADSQLAAAAATAREAGMRIGLYLDLAVGEAPDGSAVWSARSSYLADATIGAPPDYFSADGQEWGLVVMKPHKLGQDAASPYRALIGHAARHCGAIRLDHVMSLWQVFVIPAGLPPRQGAFVRYPVDDLLRVLASSSRDGGFVVVGEDLGHVPEGFREVMASAGVLSYRILYFEQSTDGGYLPAADYPELSIACASTHDLPTLMGWWRGDDIGLRQEHELIDEQMAREQRRVRAEERSKLIGALVREGAIAGTGQSAPDDEDISAELVVAVHRFLAQSPALLVGVRLADLVGEPMPTNLPGTVDAYPNWRRRCRVMLDKLEAEPLFRAVTSAVAEVRPR